MNATDLPLRGRSAIITGGGSGIGLACARRLLKDGASVTIAGRTEARLRDAAASLEREAPPGGMVRSAICDVTEESSVARAIECACAATGHVDVAVANAGSASASPILSTPVEAWRAVLETNLTGTFLTIKHAGQAMSRSGGGSIIGISSIAGALTHRFAAAYCASKAALEMLVRVAADELGSAGIRVNAIRPGLVPTDLATPLTEDQAIVRDYLEQMPLGRLGTTEDVAAAVRYLAGPESSWVTGQCFAVDGGHTLRRGPNFDPLVERFFGADAASSTRRG